MKYSTVKHDLVIPIEGQYWGVLEKCIIYIEVAASAYMIISCVVTSLLAATVKFSYKLRQNFSICMNEWAKCVYFCSRNATFVHVDV